MSVIFSGNFVKNMEARGMIIDLPEPEDLTARELAIHILGYEAGMLSGARQEKVSMLRKFQIAMFGHVL